jgi:hypothetical protein
VRPFSPIVHRAFDAWINRETWYRGNPQDEQSFYAFAWAFLRYAGREPGQGELRDRILELKTGKFEAEYLHRLASEYDTLFRHLYDFTKARKNPGVPSPEVARFLMEAKAAER